MSCRSQAVRARRRSHAPVSAELDACQLDAVDTTSLSLVLQICSHGAHTRARATATSGATLDPDSTLHTTHTRIAHTNRCAQRRPPRRKRHGAEGGAKKTPPNGNIYAFFVAPTPTYGQAQHQRRGARGVTFERSVDDATVLPPREARRSCIRHTRARAVYSGVRPRRPSTHTQPHHPVLT